MRKFLNCYTKIKNATAILTVAFLFLVKVPSLAEKVKEIFFCQKSNSNCLTYKAYTAKLSTYKYKKMYERILNFCKFRRRK